MNRQNIITAITEVEKAFAEQSALCRNRGDTDAGIQLHAMANALFIARNRLRQKWTRIWYKPWSWI